MTVTYVIPDVHQKAAELEKIEALLSFNQAEDVVFLGDFFDSHDHTDQEMREALLIMERICTNFNVTYLLGNHDVGYAQWFVWAGAPRCPGYQKTTNFYLRHQGGWSDYPNFSRLVNEEMKIAAVRGNYLLSHAGVSRQHWHPGYRYGISGFEATAQRINETFKYNLGYRYDLCVEAGPMWDRIVREPLQTGIQIVGHTSVDHVAKQLGEQCDPNRIFYRLRPDFIYIDNELRAIVAIEDGKTHRFIPI